MGKRQLDCPACKGRKMGGMSRMCALCHQPRSQLGSKMTYLGPYKVWMCGMCAKVKANHKKAPDALRR